MEDTITASCIADVKALLGEGPVWVARDEALYWVDIKGRKIFCLSAGGEVATVDTPFRIGAIAPRAGGGFIAGSENGLVAIDLETRRFDLLGNPEQGRPGNRFNDGKVDRAGNFWAGTMDDAERAATGALYRIDASLRASMADDNYMVTNGPAFSPDGRTLYHNDSARQLTYAFDLGPDGALSNRRVFAQFGYGDGYPDGMTVDAEGCLWIAFWDGWCLRRFAPSGELLARVILPVQRPTSCAFGGPALGQLFVTSARIGLDEKAIAMQPYAGGLFVLRPGVGGIAELPFAG